MEIKLSPAALLLWRILWVLESALFFTLLGLLAARFPSPLTFVLLGLCILLQGLGFFWYLPRLHASMILTLNAQAVVLIRGVFVRQKYILPLPRLIYAESFFSPLSALLGLRNLRLRAARGRLTVYGLRKEDIGRVLAATGAEPREVSP